VRDPRRLLPARGREPLGVHGRCRVIHVALSTLATNQLGRPTLVDLVETEGGETLRLVDEQGPSSFTATITHGEMLAWPRSVCDLRREVVRGLVERQRTVGVAHV
jgi:hypothetical protein